jgi:hypothetical protein
MNRELQIGILESISHHATGTSFVLMMEHNVKGHGSSNYELGYKDYSYHPRFDQPCQGGETRKYTGFNKDVTQPHNKKPSDLYHPFPEGKPSAISFPLGGVKRGKDYNEPFFKAMFSNESPWLKGFGSSSNVRFMTDDKGLAYGVIIGVENLDVDPTVMINCIQMLKNTSGQSFLKLTKAGLTNNEALAVMMLNRDYVDGSIQRTYDYYFPPVFSARRFFNQKPNDLSGGHYSDRTDYNRTYVQDVFLAGPEDNGIRWYDAMVKETGAKVNLAGWGSVPKVEFNVFIKAAKAVFTRALKEEGPLTNKPYQYRDAQGRVIDLSKPKVKKVKTPKVDEVVSLPIAKEAA